MRANANATPAERADSIIHGIAEQLRRDGNEGHWPHVVSVSSLIIAACAREQWITVRDLARRLVDYPDGMTSARAGTIVRTVDELLKPAPDSHCGAVAEGE